MGTKMTWSGLRARIADWHLHSSLRKWRDKDFFARIGQSLKGDEVVLDFGAGTGYLSLAAAACLPKGKVIALDLSADMLARLAHRASGQGLTERIEVVEAEATQSGLADGVADVVISCAVLHELPDKQKAVAEIHRLLRPGGRLLIKDFENRGLMRLAKLFHHGNGGAIKITDLDRLLRDAGFGDLYVVVEGSCMVATARKPSLQ